MFVYLDNSSTTRPYDEVIKVVADAMSEDYGNPSSLHRLGIRAERKLKDARRDIALPLGVREEEIMFTSGGTESDNLAIFGTIQGLKRYGDKIIISQIEHPAVFEMCRNLKSNGWNVVVIGVDEYGMIDMKALENEIDQSTILVSVMHVNNEVGTVQPIDKIGTLLKKWENVYFHVDGVQSFGKIPTNPQQSNIDLYSVSGHKIHGPKGVGALYVRNGVRLLPFAFGGGQEKGLRAGTENVPAIAGFGKAAALSCSGQSSKYRHVAKLKADFLEGIKAEISDFRVNGYVDDRCSPYILSVGFEGVKGEILLHSLEQSEIYVSTRSACSSRKNENSYVLQGMKVPESFAEGTIRFGFSEFTTKEEIEYTLQHLKRAVADIRRTIRR